MDGAAASKVNLVACGSTGSVMAYIVEPEEVSYEF